MLHLNLLWIKNNRVFWAAKTLEEDLRMESTWSVFALLTYLYTDLAVSKILPKNGKQLTIRMDGIVFN